jgi:hypothetical protein
MTIDGSLLLQEEREKKGATCCLHSGRNLAEKKFKKKAHRYTTLTFRVFIPSLLRMQTSPNEILPAAFIL